MSKIKITLAGNPNVGKSTIFNALTGLNQHTGNWPGKTVGNAIGEYNYNDSKYVIYDLPGTYSLNSNSKEEAIARNFICSLYTDVTVVVCDATNLERNLNLVLQIMEINSNVIVCVNLLDEARKKKIRIDLVKLEKLLGVPVIGTAARSKEGIEELKELIEVVSVNKRSSYLEVEYSLELEEASKGISDYLDTKEINFNKKWLALRMLDDDKEIVDLIDSSLYKNKELLEVVYREREKVKDLYLIKDMLVNTIVNKASWISDEVVEVSNLDYQERNIFIDKIVTSKIWGIPLMVLMLLLIFWLTIVFSNYPSDLLYNFLFGLEDNLIDGLGFLPESVVNMLVYGVYRTVAWVTSVMLPPMAIFFPLFTILEDLGVLPRIAFNLDKCFMRCQTCGKQALTMCMGFGCNAVGVTGCRIIDSPRERLIAILTNSLVPCNGRFPMLIAIITMFFANIYKGMGSSLVVAFMLALVILFSVMMTLIVSWGLSKTILRGVPSAFTLELPSYRKPLVLKVIVRSVLDRTLFVLGRALMVAAPSGLIIYLLSNIMIDGSSLLNICTGFLDGFAYYIGLDGVILMAFILGFPANEIVISVMMMAYMSKGMLINYENLDALKTLFVSNGWTWLTAICTIIFSLLHFPCSTTCLTIKKETGSWKWTGLAIIIPTVLGLSICFFITTLVRLFGLV